MSYFKLEVHITGPHDVLGEIEQQTGLRRAPFRSNFSLNRVVPFPLNEVVTNSQRTDLAVRIRDEVLTPWRNILADEKLNEDQRRTMEDELACIVIRTCEGVTRARGIPDHAALTRWRLENWGCDSDVEDRPSQSPISGEGDPETIHVSIPFPDYISTPPLIAFDSIASRWPAIRMIVTWDGSEQSYGPSGVGFAKWHHGVREESASCDDRDRSARYGRLHSLLPLRLASELSDLQLPKTRCRPTLRYDLTADELQALNGNETIEIELGPDHDVTVGCGERDDFNIIGYRLGGYDYCDGRGIEYDEVWHRIPGRVAGMKVALSLHCADAVEVNRAETILTQGTDPILEWVRECRII